MACDQGRRPSPAGRFSWPGQRVVAEAGAEQARFAALRHRDYRLFWLGRLLSVIGSQMQQVAVSWHVYQLLKGQVLPVDLPWGGSLDLGASALGLGAVGLVRILPVFVFALLGGLAADSHPRRRILLVTQSLATLNAGLLAALTLSGQATLPRILLLLAVGAAVTGFDEPARQSMVVNLVPRPILPSAINLNTLLFFGASIVGPALAGLLVGTVDVGWVYVVDALSFLGVLAALLAMGFRDALPDAPAGFNWTALSEGLRFTFQQRLVRSTMVLDFVATFFSSGRYLLPIIATELLGLGPLGYGLLSTAQAVGAVLAGLVLGLRPPIRRQGAALFGGVVVYGLASALFGLSTAPLLSYLLFALTGAGDMVSTVVRGTIRQTVTPDALRGRMTSVNMLFFMGGPQLGEVEAGAVASVWGPSVAMVTGGLATLVYVGWLAWKQPELRRLGLEHLVAAD
jgi:MFS family permease